MATVEAGVVVWAKVREVWAGETVKVKVEVIKKMSRVKLRQDLLMSSPLILSLECIPSLV